MAIETDEGIGETLYKRKAKMVEAGIHELARYLTRQDPTRIEDHFEKMYRDAFLVGGGLQPAPISAFEIALWDILGKQLQAPIYKLMGGPTRDRVPVYYHILYGPAPETFVQNSLRRVQHGYRTLKTTLRLFYGAGVQGYVDGKPVGLCSCYSGTCGKLAPSHKETELLAPDTLPRIRDFFVAARETLVPQIQLMVDCHGRLSPKTAIRWFELLADLKLLFVEEPVPPENEAALRFVAERSPTPIATGERWSTIYDARRFLSKHVSVAQPDVVWCGGLSLAKKIAAFAESEYVGVAPHNSNGPLATMASPHLATSIPNFLILETVGSDEVRQHESPVASPLPSLEDGCLPLPKGPGLGIDLDWDACNRFPYQAFDGWR